MRLIPARGTLSMGMAISEPPALLQGLPAAGRANSLDETQRSSCGLVDLLTFKCPLRHPKATGSVTPPLDEADWFPRGGAKLGYPLRASVTSRQTIDFPQSEARRSTAIWTQPTQNFLEVLTECSPENRNGPQTAERPRNEEVSGVQIPPLSATESGCCGNLWGTARNGRLCGPF